MFQGSFPLTNLKAGVVWCMSLALNTRRVSRGLLYMPRFVRFSLFLLNTTLCSKKSIFYLPLSFKLQISHIANLSINKSYSRQTHQKLPPRLRIMSPKMCHSSCLSTVVCILFLGFIGLASCLDAVRGDNGVGEDLSHATKDIVAAREWSTAFATDIARFDDEVPVNPTQPNTLQKLVSSLEEAFLFSDNLFTTMDGRYSSIVDRMSADISHLNIELKQKLQSDKDMHPMQRGTLKRLEQICSRLMVPGYYPSGTTDSFTRLANAISGNLQALLIKDSHDDPSEDAVPPSVESPDWWSPAVDALVGGAVLQYYILRELHTEVAIVVEHAHRRASRHLSMAGAAMRSDLSSAGSLVGRRLNQIWDVVRSGGLKDEQGLEM